MRFLTLAEALVIAEAVTGISAHTLQSAARIELLDSALHAPQAGFGDEDFHPTPEEKAAVLCVRLARNHPLPRLVEDETTLPVEGDDALAPPRRGQTVDGEVDVPEAQSITDPNSDEKATSDYPARVLGPDLVARLLVHEGRSPVDVPALAVRDGCEGHAVEIRQSLLMVVRHRRAG